MWGTYKKDSSILGLNSKQTDLRMVVYGVMTYTAQDRGTQGLAMPACACGSDMLAVFSINASGRVWQAEA